MDYSISIQPDEDSWPWVSLGAYFETSLAGLESLTVKYKSTDEFDIVLDQKSLSEKGTSFRANAEASSDWKSLTLGLSDFIQPEYASPGDTLITDSIKSVSFKPVPGYTSVTEGRIEIEELIFSFYGGDDPSEHFTLTVISDNGNVSRSPEKEKYESGEVVTLTASPLPKYDFISWSGDVYETSPSVQIVMNGNKVVRANFASVKNSGNTVSFAQWIAYRDDYGSDIDSGNGVVIDEIAALEYSIAQQSDKDKWPWVVLTCYLNNSLSDLSSVTITYRSPHGADLILDQPSLAENNTSFRRALPPGTDWRTVNIPISQFSQPECGEPDDSLDLNAITTVSFSPLPSYTSRTKGRIEISELIFHDVEWDTEKRVFLETEALNGTVSRLPDKDEFLYGEEVTLTANPDPGFVFTHWSGDLVDSSSSVVVVMDEDKAIRANFLSTKNSGNVVSLAKWDVYSDEYGSSVDTGSGVMIEEAATMVYSLIKQPDEDTWPWVKLTAGFIHSLEGLTSIAVTYRSSERFYVTLDQPSLNQEGKSYRAAVRSSSEWETIHIELSDFAQPEHVTSADSLRLDSIRAVSFDPIPAYSSETAGKIEIRELLFYGLEWDQENLFTLKVNASNGTVQQIPEKAYYNKGEQVRLIATPLPGYNNFTGWTGDFSGSYPDIIITMDGNFELTANFDTLIDTTNPSSNLLALMHWRVNYDTLGSSADTGTSLRCSEGVKVTLNRARQPDGNLWPWTNLTGSLGRTNLENVTAIKLVYSSDLPLDIQLPMSSLIASGKTHSYTAPATGNSFDTIYLSLEQFIQEKWVEDPVKLDRKGINSFAFSINYPDYTKYQSSVIQIRELVMYNWDGIVNVVNKNAGQMMKLAAKNLTRSAIRFSAPEGYCRIVLYSLNGRKIAVINNGFLEAGIHEVGIRHLNLSAGTVLVRITSENETIVSRMTVR
ncbi:exported hypothetical protein [Chitinispirillum alkaliphilum]|nr:exported hypothetical protein [Chitinispirillum alkaliphilum]